jgi:pimeloyl-ACP methyl ester carboxylesterase
MISRSLPIMILAVAAVAGCGGDQPYVTPERLNRGLVIVLTGIEGRSAFNEDICKGLDDGGVRYAVELYDWTSRLGPLYNLRAGGRNHKQSQEIADYIRRYHRVCPGRPVFLVGQSGGGAIAVWVAEELGPSQVEGVVLLAASLSPKYRLDKALGASARGVISYYSHRDWFLLGTNIAGTMDGELTSSAGRIGFDVPSPAPGVYKKLWQIPWQPHMADMGHTGGHLTSGDSSFVSHFVAPFINTPTWDEFAVGRVTGVQKPKPAPEYIVLPARL